LFQINWKLAAGYLSRSAKSFCLKSVLFILGDLLLSYMVVSVRKVALAADPRATTNKSLACQLSRGGRVSLETHSLDPRPVEPEQKFFAKEIQSSWQD
jgi:hypothetical protein